MNMNKKIGIAIAAIVIAGGSFYAGMSYQSAQSPARRNAGAVAGNFAGGRFGGTGSAGGVATGQVIASDSQSLTLSLRGGGSKIVFVSSSTQISKMSAGTLKDLPIGINVTVTGTANTDGSMNAQSIQIRPASTTPPFTASQNQTGQ